MASSKTSDDFARYRRSDLAGEITGVGTNNLFITNRLLTLINRVLEPNRALPAFPPELEARFEADMRRQRVRHLRRAILLGLVMVHLYGLSSFVADPDGAMPGLVLRAGVVTPMVLCAMWLIGSVDGRTREAVCGLGMLAAAAVSILTVILGGGPLESLGAPSLWLVVIFGNNLLSLRFPWACLLAVVTGVASLATVTLKDGATAPVSALTERDILATILISLVAARQIESAQRRGYLLHLRETLRSRHLVAENSALAQLARTDPLTGLANRRAFTERLDRLWDAARAGSPFALLLVDIDHFKRFNDLYGRGAGDACLRDVADLLQECAPRGGDMVARYGGEEFAVLLPGLDGVGAVAVAERIRTALEARRFPHAGRGDGLNHLTVSVGVAASSDGSPTPAALVDAADAALYQAKSAGRNRVGPIPAPPARDAVRNPLAAGLAA